MQPQPSMLPAPIEVPPDRKPLLSLTEDPEERKRREAKEYDDSCDENSVALCVALVFAAGLIALLVFVIVEAATNPTQLGNLDGPFLSFAWGLWIFFIVVLLFFDCWWLRDILQKRYDRTVEGKLKEVRDVIYCDNCATCIVGCCLLASELN